MKKSYTYLLFVLIFIATAGFIVVRNKMRENERSTATYRIKERKGPSAQTSEWVRTKATANALGEAIRKNPNDDKSILALAALFIQEARITGNYQYYDPAVLKYVSDVLKKDPGNFEALIYKAIIQLSQHHFNEGLATATKAKTGNPYNAFVYGIMIDANVELGNYTEAIENADRMVSIRPDLRSYSRIAYLREIHGDISGAIEAMKLAIEAGMPGNEATEWCRVQLGKLYEQEGEIKNAEMEYNISLEESPGYAYALAGLARIEVAKGNFQRALTHYNDAFQMVNDYSFREEIIKIYRQLGQYGKAGILGNKMISEMTATSQNLNDDSAGHYSDRELAYAWLTVNNHDRALEHAILEYNRRPDNIDVNETLAWVFYKKGDHQKALMYIRSALRTNCKNPDLLIRAGLIYAKAGMEKEGNKFLQEALKKNPVIAPELKSEYTVALKKYSNVN
ncbi:MAG TPA: hypothetical protein VGD17_01110 [Chitinophagaceae bacterium]